jgi:hypothetical protein
MTACIRRLRLRRFAAVMAALAVLLALAPGAAVARAGCTGGTHYDQATITSR